MQDRILVLGGSSLVAAYLIPRIDRRSLSVTVVARQAVAVPDGVGFLPLAALQSPTWRLPPGTTVVSLLPLTALGPLLPALEGATAILALGSTSRFSKAHSPDPAERAAAEALVHGESVLAAWCDGRATSYTLLRPTLVYDMVQDLNLARMARVIRRYRVLPLARPATGLRQPIHADDVAKALLGAIGNAEARDRMFNIAGGEVLTYRAMAERVFAALGLRARFVVLPVGVLQLGFEAAERLGIVRDASFGSSVFQRMNEDLVFEVADGLRALDYRPRPFDPRVPHPSGVGF